MCSASGQDTLIKIRVYEADISIRSALIAIQNYIITSILQFFYVNVGEVAYNPHDVIKI